MSTCVALLEGACRLRAECVLQLHVCSTMRACLHRFKPGSMIGRGKD